MKKIGYMFWHATFRLTEQPLVAPSTTSDPVFLVCLSLSQARAKISFIIF